MDSQQETQEEPGHGTAQAFSNCLNPILVLVSIPLYILAFAAAGAGMLLGRLAPGWLPDWLQFTTSGAFLVVALGLLVWFLIVQIILSARLHNTIDFCGIEVAFLMLEDGLSGYLLFGGLVMAGIVIRLTLF